MRLAASMAAFVLAFATSPVQSALLFYDPFLTGNNPAAGQYSVGLVDPSANVGDGQNPILGPTPFLAGPWETVGTDAAPNAAIQEAGLSFIGAPALGGSQISTPNSDVRRYLSSPWTDTTEGTYYVSFLANFGQGDYSDGIDNNDMGYRAVELYNADNTFLLGVAYNAFNSSGGSAQQDPRTARLYLDGFGYQVLQNAPDNFIADGATHLVVLRFGLGAVPSSDNLSVYLDPSTAEEPVIPNATLTGVNLTLGAIGGFTIYGGSGQGPVMDELRVADSFIDVLPDFPLPGDTNGDDLVDMADYQNIRAHMNLSGAAVPNTLSLHPDVTGDGRVTIADYRRWKDHRTDLTGAAADLSSDVGVPEPSTFFLAVVGAVLASTSCGVRFSLRLEANFENLHCRARRSNCSTWDTTDQVLDADNRSARRRIRTRRFAACGPCLVV